MADVQQSALTSPDRTQVLPTLERTIFQLSHALDQAVSDLLHRDEIAERVCDEIKRDLKFDLAAVQLLNFGEQTIYTVHGSGPKGPWYNLGSHSLTVDPMFRDIQADIAKSSPPRIEIIEGWDLRFDEFIYRQFHHEHYFRAFVPLILSRQADGQFAAVDPTDFTFIPVHNKHCIIELRTRTGISATASYELIGTIEAGFDNADPAPKRDIPLALAYRLFEHSCRYAFELFKVTPLSVVNLAVQGLRQLFAADCSSLHLWLDAQSQRYRFNVWAGKPLAAKLDPRENVLAVSALESGSLQSLPAQHDGADRLPLLSALPALSDIGITQLAAFPFKLDEYTKDDTFPTLRQPRPQDGLLYLGFNDYHRFTEEERAALTLFTELARSAIRHATDYLEAVHSARHIANLYDTAKALAEYRDTQDLLETVARHALNVLAADLVIIYEYDPKRECSNPAVGGRHEPALPGPGDLDGSYILPRRLLDSLKDVYRESPDQVADLYAIPTPLDICKEFVRTEQIRSAAGILLTISSEVVGVMFVNYRRDHIFSRYDKVLIDTLASIATVAIRNGRLMTAREDAVLAMTHQLKIPLRDDAMTAQRLKRAVDQPIIAGDWNPLANDIRRMAEHLDVLAALCDGIYVALSPAEHRNILEPADIQVHQEIVRLWNLVAHARCRTDISFSTDTEAADTIKINRMVFTNVVYTLFHNASKYNDPDSQVNVSWNTSREGRFCLAVRSIGKPIHRDETERIFLKFTRGAEMQRAQNSSGTGLGLWVAKELLHLVEADIQVVLDDTEPRSSTFLVRRPAGGGN